MPALRSFRWLLIFTTMVVTLQLIAAQAMAASPSLHDQCHDHSHLPDHTCVVTLMLSGGYECGVPDIVPVTIAVETPDVPVSISLPAGIVPCQLLGSVLADAPPRGP